MAASQLEDNVVLGTMMLALDEVDGLVSGAVHSTANTIRPALQVIKTKPNARAVSSVFFMCSGFCRCRFKYRATTVVGGQELYKNAIVRRPSPLLAL
jgi:phosphotransacetylase